MARETPSPLARRVLLGVSLAVVILSCLLTQGSDNEQVMVPLLNQPLPPLCSLKRYTGLDCPGCGLTRSFIATAHGQFRAAVAHNPAGLYWFALIAGQIPWQAWQLRRIARGEKEIDLAWWGQSAIYLGLAALIGQWVVRQFPG